MVLRDPQSRALHKVRPAAQVAIGVAAASAVLVAEALARAGLAVPDPRPLFLVAVVAAAAFGGAAPAAATVAVTWLYCFHYFAAGGHADASPFHGTLPPWTYLVYAPVAAALVLLKRQRSSRLAGAALDAERGRAAVAVADSAGLNRAVLDSLPAHVAVLDAAGRIIATNGAWSAFANDNPAPPDAAARPIGATGTSVNYLDVCRGAVGREAPQAAAVADGIADVLAGRKDEFRLEYPCHGPARERWFLLTVTPLRWPAAGDGDPARAAGPKGVVVSHLDITDRKLAERTVRGRAVELAGLARDLKRTNAELDQFAYITSHDLRALLRGIANLSQWIEEDLAGQAPPETRKQLELLRGRVNRMEAMIDGILQYSRVGRVHGEVGPVDVGRLVADAVDLLALPPEFRVEAAPDLPAVVTERLRLQQVFMNLIGNAIKHHDRAGNGGGTIRVGWRDASEEEYEFTVADDGPGIDPQYHERVFRIFQTLQPRDRVEGTGVGLALVRKIVETFGGTVAVESPVADGRGTAFRFTWPKRSPDAPPAVDSGADFARASDGTGE